MPVIDVHAHVFPDAIAEAAVSALADEGGITPCYDGTIAGLIEAMDRGGVDRSVIVPVATKPTQVRSINDWVASVASDRLVPFGAMHPDFDDPAGEMERMVSLGIRGIKLHSQHQSFLPQEERMSPIYEAAAKNGIAILFHAGGYVVEHEAESHPADFAAMLDSYPHLTCVLAHMGGYQQWDEVFEHLCGRDVYLDTAYVPRHLPDERFITLIRRHGVERVLLGSDGPWADVGAEIQYLRSMDLTSGEVEAILGGNAARMLDI